MKYLDELVSTPVGMAVFVAMLVLVWWCGVLFGELRERERLWKAERGPG